MGAIEWMILWYLTGFIVWMLFCWDEGVITVGDIAAAFLMGFIGPLLPTTLAACCLGWKWYQFCQKEVWRRKSL